VRYSLRNVKNRYIWLPLLRLNPRRSGSLQTIPVKFSVNVKIVNGWPSTKRRRKIAENFNKLSRVHERYRQTTDRRTGDSIIANANVSSRSLKVLNGATSLPLRQLPTAKRILAACVSVIKVTLHEQVSGAIYWCQKLGTVSVAGFYPLVGCHHWDIIWRLVAYKHKNSSGDEIANVLVNDDIAHT